MTTAPQMQKKRDQRTPESDTFHRLAKVTELIGNSKTSFDDAIKSALMEASKTVRHISGADCVNMSVKCEEGKVIEYRVNLKIVFGVENDRM
jgi:flavin-binding protein dodecin